MAQAIERTASQEAVIHIIKALRDDPRKAYYMGESSGCFEHLCKAYAEIFGKTVEESAAHLRTLFRYEGPKCVYCEHCYPAD